MNQSNSHTAILSALAGLTILFLGAAAFSFWGNLSLELPSESRILKNSPSQIRDISPYIDIIIEESGITAVTATDLRKFNLIYDTFSANSLQLTHVGQPVPFWVNSKRNTLYFYAQANNGALESTAVYQLSAAKGTSIAEQEAIPTAVGREIGIATQQWQQFSNSLASSSNETIWLGQLLLAPHQWELPLSNIRTSGGAATLKIQVWSNSEDASDPDHHVTISLNGEQLLSHFWDGIHQETITIDVPDGILQPNIENILTISTPGDTHAVAESIYINKIELDYEQKIELRGNNQLLFKSESANVWVKDATMPLLVFDVTDPDQPIRFARLRQQENGIHFAGGEGVTSYAILSPSQAIVPTLRIPTPYKSPLRQADRGADYIAIVPDNDNFLETVQPLLTHRQEDGLRVTAVSLSQIYAEFGYGEQSPAAIQQFLAYTAANWQPPAPRFVLLVGDASIDIQDRLNGKNNNLLPTYLYTNSHGQYLVSDAWFTLFDNATTPQMAIGRFPAQTTAQLAQMVTKTIAYETSSDSSWQNRALFVADNTGQSNMISDNLAHNLDMRGYDIHKLYSTTTQDIHYDILGALSKGVGLVNYSGRGQAQFWGNGNLFHARNADMLHNSGRFPILTSFTCNNGAFGDPQTDSLAESLLWVEDGGIVAAISASGTVESMSQTLMAEQFYNQLFVQQAPTIGEAFILAKTAVSHDPTYQDAIHAFHLLGDPALRPQRP